MYEKGDEEGAIGEGRRAISVQFHEVLLLE